MDRIVKPTGTKPKPRKTSWIGVCIDRTPLICMWIVQIGSCVGNSMLIINRKSCFFLRLTCYFLRVECFAFGTWIYTVFKNNISFSRLYPILTVQISIYSNELKTSIQIKASQNNLCACHYFITGITEIKRFKCYIIEVSCG